MRTSAGEEAPTITQWGNVLLDACAALGVRSRVSVEPGRAIVASAAITVYEVGTIKDIPGVRTYVAVDGGMSDNPRPVLYGSGYESFLPRAVDAERDRTVRLVGKHCESGDVLSFAAQVPADIVVGDLLAMPVTGAYGHSMGSNYNKITRPPVVFAADGEVRLVVRRETYEISSPPTSADRTSPDAMSLRATRSREGSSRSLETGGAAVRRRTLGAMSRRTGRIAGLVTAGLAIFKERDRFAGRTSKQSQPTSRRVATGDARRVLARHRRRSRSG